jgi:alpha-beta hydrolase superfamily lysophospholipase
VTLSDNREAVDVIRSDPLVVQKSRFDTLNGIVDLMDKTLEASSKLDYPILLLYGLNDEIVSKSAVCDFLALPAEKPVTVFYPEGYHLLLRDRQRDIVLRDITAWLTAPDAPVPSGFGYSCE